MWRSVVVCVILLLVTADAAPVEEKCDPVVQENAKKYAEKHPNVRRGNPEQNELFQCNTSLRENATLYDKRSPLNSVYDPKYIWPNGTIYYTIQNGAFKPDEISKIESAIAQLVNLTKVNGKSCIQITPRKQETEYINVIKDKGCYSKGIGRTGYQQHNLSLAVECLTPGTIMHEFLHAFGFYHEQSRVDRDNYISINYCNINPELYGQFEMEDDDPLGTSYDLESVMHYAAYAGSVDRTIPAMFPKNLDLELKTNDKLSPIDIERVKILYKCLAPADSRFYKHLDRK